ncbi:dihydrodipicolinate synthase family protein [Acidimangrovimonas sediminis]|uniref:dihydrodipicolinate synthase family protein n=1 Tax=Acidimangrovimonas sediminis TaxID=2056283 RepID=UPI00130481D4|nr:dihydrodipicolinate synthase family protein [Acidimangrovimonas sediminis]
MTTPTLRGLMPACPTALTPEGAADPAGMKALVRYMLDGGASGLVPLGGTGEYTALSPATRKATVAACVEAAAGAPVFAGVLAPGLGDALPAARDFAEAGADGLMLMVPYYARNTQEGVIDYFRAVRDAVDLPIMLYDNPARSHYVLDPDTIATLAEDATIIAMKASNTDLYHFDQVMRRVGPGFAPLSGQDTLFAQQVAMGAVGGVLTSAVVVPGIWAQVQTLAETGRMDDALSLQRSLIPLMDALFAEENPAPLRHALDRIGLPTGLSQLPLRPLSAGAAARIDRVLDDLRSAGATLPAAGADTLTGASA